MLSSGVAGKVAKGKIAKGPAALMLAVHKLIEKRNRRLAEEQDFYRKLASWCRAHNMPCVCEDDWRMTTLLD